MRTINHRAVILLIAGIIFGFTLAYAPAQSAVEMSQQLAAAAQPLAPKEVPEYGTFWSLQRTNYPPLPFLNFSELPVYYLGYGNAFLVDDSTVDYVAVAEAREADKALRKMELQYGLREADELDALEETEGGGMMLMAFDYPTNNALWLEITQVTNGFAYVTVHGTVSEMVYEILSKRTLTNGEWASEGTILGAAEQDWTPTMVPVLDRTNSLFLWARSWVDTDGDGLPDWWELAHGLDPNNPDTGNTGVSDGYKDSDGDGWTNLQEYQNGTNPNSFNTPPPPRNVVARLDATGTNVILTWESGGGPVASYAVENGSGSPIETGLSSNTHTFMDDLDEPILGSPYGVEGYAIRAYFPGGSSSVSAAVIPIASTLEGYVVRGAGGLPYLVMKSPPPNLARIRFSWWPSTPNPGDPTYPWFEVSATNMVNGTILVPLDQLQRYPSLPFYVYAIMADGSFTRIYEDSLFENERFWGGRWNGFIDAQLHLKENLRFLLRSATVTRPFSYDGPDYFVRPATSTNYEYAGYRTYDSYYGYDYSFMDELRPIEEHYLWRNYVYDPYDYSTLGLTNGADYDYSYEIRSLVGIPKHRFTGTASNSPPAALAFGLTNSTWLFFAWAAPSTYSFSLAPELGVYTNGGGQFYLANNVRNCYGLLLNSLRVQTTAPVAAGSLLSQSNGTYSLNFEQPVLQTVDYYFNSQTPYFNFNYEYGTPRPPLPGTPDFNVTNTTPLLLIASVGHMFSVAGWAKQAITNGYANKFGYLEQYFDKAFKTTNGVVMTNQTGILSPYGEFFPTEPGRVALVTMPDIETGQRGTAVVNVVKLQLDVNHDGNMDLSFGGPDNTSWSRPFQFWVNSDRDVNEKDNDMKNAPRGQDYGDTVMGSMRDLEDFSRLWIAGLPALPSSNGYTVTLSWRNIIGGYPAIRLYRACETNGGTAYLQDTNVAAQQITVQNGFPLGSGYGDCLSLLPISLAAPFTFPANFFAVAGTNKYFLFEGAGIGSGELVLTIAQGTNVIAETSVWLDLKDVKDMYERVNIQNVTDATPNSLVSVYKEDNIVGSIAGEDTNVVVFVHGWRMGVWDYYSFSESMFKRLYWQGYQGRFVSIRWQTLSQDTDGTIGQFATYNKSEFRAFQSGRGVSDYLTHLRSRFPNYKIGVASHSMGGIVMAQALKLQLAAGQTNIDNYVLMQAAVPVHCYDTNLANYSTFSTAEAATHTPDTYRGYPGAISGAVANRLVNFYNTNDFALATGILGGLAVHWEKNQVDYKPDSGFGYSTDGTNAYKNSVLVTDPRQIMAFVARPRSKAVGAQPGVGGVITTAGQVNLKETYGFNTDKSEHSAQFNWNIQRLNAFYADLLSALFPQP